MEILLFQNVDRFHWQSGFCIIIFTERCFCTDYSKFTNVPKKVSDIDLFRYECKLVIFFSPLNCYVRNTVFSFTVAQNVNLNGNLVFKIYFSGYTEDLFTKEIMFRLLFLHGNLDWKNIVLKRSKRNSMKLFCNSQLFVTSHSLYSTHKKPYPSLSLSPLSLLHLYPSHKKLTLYLVSPGIFGMVSNNIIYLIKHKLRKVPHSTSLLYLSSQLQ